MKIDEKLMQMHNKTEELQQLKQEKIKYDKDQLKQDQIFHSFDYQIQKLKEQLKKKGELLTSRNA